jgi:hypothetical protein
MANKINTVPSLKPDTEKPIVVDETNSPAAAEEEKVERVADRAAHKAAKTQQQYDQEHTTFSN